MPKVFYSEKEKHEIYDTSGEMSLDTLNTAKPSDDYQVVSISDAEAVRLKNGVLEKFNIQEELDAQVAVENTKQQQARNELKGLGISDATIDVLLRGKTK